VNPTKIVKQLLFKAQDACHAIANRGQSALPPPSLRTVGGGDFHRVGAHNVRCIRKFTALDTKRILEIGCGSGRNALALLTYDVTYHGIDIYKPYISWCVDNIASQNANFHFHHADIYNGFYNASGKVRSADFRFPFPDSSFDLIFLTSVFTHMMEDDAIQYIREISRLLVRGGSMYGTFFLLNRESNALMDEGKAHQKMQTFSGRTKVVLKNQPEAAVGLDEEAMLGAMKSNGLDAKPPAYGSWCGRSAYFDYQDVIFAVKS
jgi:SAM-dependent methyltransferase